MIAPIWKDLYVTVGAGRDSVLFRIVVDSTDEVIYSGKAFKRPGATACSIKINDICADYLSLTLPTLTNEQFSRMSFPLTFRVEWYNGSAWTATESTYTLLNDWSYDGNYDVQRDGMCLPILRKADNRQWVMWTGVDVSSVVATLAFEDGSEQKVTIPIAISADFNSDFNSDFARSARSSGSGTAVFSLSKWDGLKSIALPGCTYEVADTCKRYVLYYVNAYGGWDSLLVEGTSKKTDTMTRHSFEQIYDNGDITNRGERNYINEVERAFSLVTGWMSDDEASRMHHLLGSTNVYLYDLLTDEMVPVVCSDNSCEYKTYKTNGNRLVNYTIGVKVAQSMTRR